MLGAGVTFGAAVAANDAAALPGSFPAGAVVLIAALGLAAAFELGRPRFRSGAVLRLGLGLGLPLAALLALRAPGYDSDSSQALCWLALFVAGGVRTLSALSDRLDEANRVAARRAGTFVVGGLATVFVTLAIMIPAGFVGVAVVRSIWRGPLDRTYGFALLGAVIVVAIAAAERLGRDRAAQVGGLTRAAASRESPRGAGSDPVSHRASGP
jgi:hypothetical protein